MGLLVIDLFRSRLGILIVRCAYKEIRGEDQEEFIERQEAC